jgi:hypothetical protein
MSNPLTNSDFLLERLFNELITEVKELKSEVHVLRVQLNAPKPVSRKKKEVSE